MEKYFCDEAKDLVANLKLTSADALSIQAGGEGREASQLENSLYLHQFALKARQIIVSQCVFYANCLKTLLTLIKRRPFTLRVGVVGCGTVGADVVKALLNSGNIRGADVMVVTRPHVNTGQKLQRMLSLGVKLETDIKLAARRCHLLYLTCLPVQIQSVATVLRGKLRPNSVICSSVAGVGTAKLQKLFNCRFILRTLVQRQWVRDPQKCDTARYLLHQGTGSECKKGKPRMREQGESQDTNGQKNLVQAALHLAARKDFLLGIAQTLDSFHSSLIGHSSKQKEEGGGSSPSVRPLGVWRQAKRGGRDVSDVDQGVRSPAVTVALFGESDQKGQPENVIEEEEGRRTSEEIHKTSGNEDHLVTAGEMQTTRALRQRFIRNFVHVVASSEPTN